MDNKRSLDTLFAHGGHHPDPVTGAVAPAITPSTTFARGQDYALPDAHSYARAGHPGIIDLETLLARADGAVGALVFASGMSGIVALLELVPTGARITAPRVMYHGTRDWLVHLQRTRDIGIDWYDAGDAASLERAVVPGKTSLVWTEVAVNPTWDVIDIAHAAEVAHAAGAELAVDATIAPSVTCQPARLGADYVFQSATKYLNGHSDVTAGVVSVVRAEQHIATMALHRTLTGSSLSPFDCWLLQRGLRTLSLRYERASANALAIAQRFAHDPRVAQVLYPGLASHPGHDVARRQMRAGFGGMMSVCVQGGAEEALAVAGRLELFARATSLGGVESLVEHRATIEGPDSPVPPNLLRMSIGIEAADDLIADIDQGLGTP